MESNTYCVKCKVKAPISRADMLYLVSNGSKYLCSSCKAKSKKVAA